MKKAFNLVNLMLEKYKNNLFKLLSGKDTVITFGLLPQPSGSSSCGVTKRNFGYLPQKKSP
jgi:hypothetical protein